VTEAAEPAGPAEWADRLRVQSAACEDLGSPLYGRLLRLLAADCAAGGVTWDVLAPHAGLRFGQAGPLRLLGAAHGLALAGSAPEWAAVLPSCGGSVPPDDGSLGLAWSRLVAAHHDGLSAGLGREVQTNEVGRSAGLALGAAAAALPDGTTLVELGCSGGLNLRFDRFEVDLGGVVLGASGSPVRLVPEMRAAAGPLGGLPRIDRRVGLDPHPVDATSADGALTLQSFVWPDQAERLARVRSAIELASAVPAELRQVDDTAVALADLLAGRSGPTLVQHSIVWQYLPTDQRWRVTRAIEEAGELATSSDPLAWVRYEPDEWDRTRAAVWLRRWPDGGDRLVAQVDFHGRWIRPVGGWSAVPGAPGRIPPVAD
jgi:hypothetical protein